MCTLLAVKTEINEPISIRLDWEPASRSKAWTVQFQQRRISAEKIAFPIGGIAKRKGGSEHRVRQWTFLPSNPINNNKADADAKAKVKAKAFCLADFQLLGLPQQPQKSHHRSPPPLAFHQVQ